MRERCHQHFFIIFFGRDKCRLIKASVKEKTTDVFLMVSSAMCDFLFFSSQKNVSHRYHQIKSIQGHICILQLFNFSFYNISIYKYFSVTFFFSTIIF